ncbi:MAG: hypothetical protein CVU43_23375, partial [Chloroflexi bacterium HGW-Chloroflexi-5]
AKTQIIRHKHSKDAEASFLNRTRTRLFKSVVNMILKDDNAIIEDSESAGYYPQNKKNKR